MTLEPARHQKPGQPGRIAKGRGEASSEAVRDEAGAARCDTEDSGRGSLLAQALASANMAAAWKRVKANGGSAGVDGLTIAATADQLKRTWPAIRASLLNGTYRPAPVRRVQIGNSWGSPSGWHQGKWSSADSPAKRWPGSSNAFGGSRVARVGAVLMSWCNAYGGICWAGSNTSAWHKRHGCSSNWINGCATGYARCN